MIFVRVHLSQFVCYIKFVTLCLSHYVCHITFVELCLSYDVCHIIYLSFATNSIIFSLHWKKDKLAWKQFKASEDIIYQLVIIKTVTKLNK